MPGAKTDNPAPRNVELRFKRKEDFLARFLPNVGIGGVLWEAPPRPRGERLTCRISVIGIQKRFILPGVVAWSQAEAPDRPDLPAGVGIEFEREGEQTLAALLHFMKHDSEDEALKAGDDRQESRLRVELQCEYLFDNKLVRGTITDISPIGLHVRSSEAPPEGKQFVFFVYDPQFIHPLVMEGRVVWTDDGENAGFGVSLQFDSRRHKLAVKQYIDGLAALFDEE
ncbi:MAG: hypothetical protein C4523_05985 [Myxococcales bacterium]|nr:MAG: hypothetical protein C4523_05985 [Myxococcales bacterium]